MTRLTPAALVALMVLASPAFAHGHAGADRPAPHGGPVSVASELWSYEVAVTS